jgi:hypothetical protein
MAAKAPISDRKLYEALRAGPGLVGQEGNFGQFRQALDETVDRGMVIVAGHDPEFGDPLFEINPSVRRPADWPAG